MSKPLLLLTLCGCLTACSLVSAQAPTYAPYGAWRGRIRYVQGPWRTRSTIKWSNGLTPTGGQVLMHGLTTAGTVLTDPNFLGAAMGQRDGEATRGDTQLQDLIVKLKSNNAEMRAELTNTVLTPLKLENTNMGSAEDDDPEPDGTSEGAEISLPDAYDAYMKGAAESQAKASSLAKHAVRVAQLAEFLETKLRVAEGQQPAFDSINTFARKVSEWLKGSIPPEAIAQVEVEPNDPGRAVVEYVSEADTLIREFTEFQQALRTVRQAGRAILNQMSHPLVRQVVDRFQQLSAELDKLGDIPNVPKDLFKDATVVATEEIPPPDAGDDAGAGEEPDAAAAPANEGAAGAAPAGEPGETPADGTP